MVVVGRHDVGQVCFPFKGLALQLFWESIRCPSESGHLASNRCAIASRDKTLVSSVEDMAPKATPSIYNSAHAHTNIYRQKIDFAAIVDFFHSKNAEA